MTELLPFTDSVDWGVHLPCQLLGHQLDPWSYYPLHLPFQCQLKWPLFFLSLLKQMWSVNTVHSGSLSERTPKLLWASVTVPDWQITSSDVIFEDGVLLVTRSLWRSFKGSMMEEQDSSTDSTKGWQLPQRLTVGEQFPQSSIVPDISTLLSWSSKFWVEMRLLKSSDYILMFPLPSRNYLRWD